MPFEFHPEDWPHKPLPRVEFQVVTAGQIWARRLAVGAWALCVPAIALYMVQTLSWSALEGLRGFLLAAASIGVLPGFVLACLAAILGSRSACLALVAYVIFSRWLFLLQLAERV